jgi:hypothetical protein
VRLSDAVRCEDMKQILAPDVTSLLTQPVDKAWAHWKYEVCLGVMGTRGCRGVVSVAVAHTCMYS